MSWFWWEGLLHQLVLVEGLFPTSSCCSLLEGVQVLPHVVHGAVCVELLLGGVRLHGSLQLLWSRQYGVWLR